MLINYSLPLYLSYCIIWDNIKTRVLVDSNDVFQGLISNRNKIGAESKLIVNINAGNPMFGPRSNDKQISYAIENNSRPAVESFHLAWDEYHLYWTENKFNSGSIKSPELNHNQLPTTSGMSGWVVLVYYKT